MFSVITTDCLKKSHVVQNQPTPPNYDQGIGTVNIFLLYIVTYISNTKN
jgi:hypothetical protein